MKRRDYNSDYSELLGIYFRVVQSSIGDFKSLADHYSFAHSLALKQFRHLSTIKNLCDPHVDKITGDLYVDHASVQALTRSSFETFLTFAHLFGPENPELTRLRFAIWRRCGLMERQKLVASLSDYEYKLAMERQYIAELKDEIEAISLFRTEYRPDQQKRLLDGEWMGVNKMPLLAKEAGVHKDYFRNIYKHSSGHSHASYISALQVAQARSLLVQTELATSCLGIGLYVMTHFLTIFVRMSQGAKKALEAEPNAKKLFALWHIQEEDWENLYAERRNKPTGSAVVRGHRWTQLMPDLKTWRIKGKIFG